MNLFRLLLSLPLITGIALAPHTVCAQNLDWSANGSGTPSGGTGNWDTTSNKWALDGTTTYQAWSNANIDAIAQFGGTAGTVTLNKNISTNGLTFNVDGYVLNSGTGFKLSLVNNSTGFGPVITVANAGQTATINATLKPIGSGATDEVTGAGTLVIGGANSGFTDNLAVVGGGTLKLVAPGSLGAGALELGLSGGAGGSGSLIYDNTGATANISQTFGALGVFSGDDTVQTNRVAANNIGLTFSNFVLVPGATVNFIINGGAIGTSNKITLTGTGTGLVNKAAFFGGSNYAWYTGAFVRGINYGVDNNTVTSGATTSIATAANKNIRITGTVSAQTTAAFKTINISGADNFTLAGGSTLTVNGLLKAGNNAAVISGGTSIKAGTTASGNDDQLVIRTDLAGDSLSISTPIVDNADGANILVKSGAGTLTLSGANTYSGGTFINGGALSIASLGSLGTGTTQINGGILQYTGATTSTNLVFVLSTGGGGIDVASGTTLTIASGFFGANTGLITDSLVKTGAGTLVLSGSDDNSGLTAIVNAGTLQLAKTSADETHALGSGLSLVVNNGGTAQLSGSGGDQIFDDSDVVINTGGTLDFNGASESFDGLSGGGTVTNTVASSLSTVTLGANNDSSGNSRDVFTGTISDGSGGAQMSLVKLGTGTQTLAGANTYTGGTTISGGTLQVGNGGTVGNLGTGGVLDNGLLVYDRTNALVDGNAISGAGSVTQTGSGTTTLTGVNTYTGPTTISGGTLQFAKRTALYDNVTANWTAANLIVQSGATLALNVGGTGEFTSGNINTLTSLGTANGGFENGSFLGLDTTNAAGGNFTYASAIANPNGGANALGLTKLGTGTLTLTSASTYTGGTTVNQGKLVLSGSINGPLVVNAATFSFAGGGTLNGNATINNGGTIGGTGSVNGKITVAGGGSTFPGDPQILTATSVEYQNGSAAQFSVATTGASPHPPAPGVDYDQIMLTGGPAQVLQIDSGTTTLQLNFDLTSLTAVQSNAQNNLNDLYFIFNLGSGTSTGQFTNLTITEGSNTYSSAITGGEATFAQLGLQFNLSYTGNASADTLTGGNDVAFSVASTPAAPEPGTWALFILGTLTLFLVRCRKSPPSPPSS